MADNDVTVKIGADTSDLDAKMARAQQMMQQGFTPVPYGLGGPPQSLLELATEKAKTQTTAERDAAVRKYAQAAKEATGATNQLSEAEDGLTTSTERAASGFERMVGRMLTRLVVFGLLFEAIRLIKEVLQESAAYEAAQVRFESLSVAVEGSAKAWEHLRSIAHETGISTEELSQAQMSLEKMGVSGGEVGGVMENLAKYAKILGVDIGTVAQEWGRLERKEGSVKDMQDLAYATHDINLERLVNDLAEAQRMAPILAERQAQIDRQINRAADDQDRALNRAIEDTDRLRNAQLGVAQAIGVAGEAYKEFIGVAGRQGGVAGPATERMKSEMALGAAQLGREGEPNVQQMRQMGMSGREIYQVLMAAAQRYHEQVRLATQRQEEDQKRLREQAQEDARENVRLKAAADLLGAEDKVAQAIQAGIGANTAFGKAMETAEGLSGLIQEHMKEIVDDATIVSTGIQIWNKLILDFIDHLKEAGKWIENTPLAKISGWLGGQNVKAQYEKEHGPGSYDALINPSKPQWGLVPGNLSMAGLTPQQFMAGSGATPRDIADKLAQKQDEANQHQADAKEILRDIYNTLQMAFGA